MIIGVQRFSVLLPVELQSDTAFSLSPRPRSTPGTRPTPGHQPNPSPGPQPRAPTQPHPKAQHQGPNQPHPSPGQLIRPLLKL